MIQKPSEKEEEYFKRQELERLRKMREEAAAQTANAERERLKQLHFMRCPKCGMELAEVAYRGVAVDVCFACGGMYLDAGEIDKVLEYKEPGLMGRMVSTLFGRDLPAD